MGNARPREKSRFGAFEASVRSIGHQRSATFLVECALRAPLFEIVFCADQGKDSWTRQILRRFTKKLDTSASL